jgi:uncharacterized heparinase superfamily protein
VAASALLLPVTSAGAVTPSTKAAKAAALAQAKKLARETHASSYRVVSCKRSTPVRYVCQIENRFKDGAKRCTASVVVNFVAQKARTTYSNYLCY